MALVTERKMCNGLISLQHCILSLFVASNSRKLWAVTRAVLSNRHCRRGPWVHEGLWVHEDCKLLVTGSAGWSSTRLTQTSQRFGDVTASKHVILYITRAAALYCRHQPPKFSRIYASRVRWRSTIYSKKYHFCWLLHVKHHFTSFHHPDTQSFLPLVYNNFGNRRTTIFHLCMNYVCNNKSNMGEEPVAHRLF